MKIGDRVRVLGTPDHLPPDGDADGLDTTSFFRRCIGREFSIVAFNEAGLAELEVGEVLDQPAYMSSIWIEPEFLELIS